MSELISVIVPVYNTGTYVETCIRSVLAQTYTHWELILVDDGSTDSSGAVCDSFAKEDKRIRVIHKPNGGVSTARNAGLDSMQGDYVFFIDSDDYIHPETLDVLLRLLHKHDADVSMCYSRGTKVRDYIEPDVPEYKEQCVSGVRALEILYSPDSFPFFGYNPTCVLFRLCKCEIFADDLRFDEKAKMAEDLTMAPFILSRANKVVSIDRRMYYVYHRPQSLTRSVMSVDRNRDLCSVVCNMYLNRLSYFESDPKFASVKQATYRIALFDLIEKYNNLKDSVCRRTLKPAYKKILKKGLKDNAFSMKYKLLFILFLFFPALQKKL